MRDVWFETWPEKCRFKERQIWAMICWNKFRSDHLFESKYTIHNDILIGVVQILLNILWFENVYSLHLYSFENVGRITPFQVHKQIECLKKMKWSFIRVHNNLRFLLIGLHLLTFVLVKTKKQIRLLYLYIYIYISRPREPIM